jgi:hypothetical protein
LFLKASLFVTHNRKTLAFFKIYQNISPNYESIIFYSTAPWFEKAVNTKLIQTKALWTYNEQIPY